ncbi:unnamed protein product [Calypogeia fissa]
MRRAVGGGGQEHGEMEIWRLPQSRYVDAVRWLPSVTPSQSPLIALGLWDSDQRKTMMEVSSLVPQTPDGFPTQVLHHSFQIPARVMSLRTAIGPSNESILLAGSRAGDVSVVLVKDPANAKKTPVPVVCPSLHKGPVSGVDLEASTQDCVTVGQDGKINLVKVGGPSQLFSKCLYDNGGLMSFSAVCWASSVEFVTGSLGSTLQWWDQRRPGGPVSQSPAKWASGTGGVNCIDIHPSRKHLCVVGGSGGAVYAWDLRWQQEPVALAGPAAPKGRYPTGGLIVESEVWEVKFDPLLQSAAHSVESGKIPPVMICSEDGVLALLDGGEMIELTAEPTAINTFDIDPENFNNVVCGLENESILYLKRAS